MRVLIIRNAYIYDFGGGERFPVYLAKELVTKGHQAVIVARQPKLLDFAQQQNLTAKKGWWWDKQQWSGLHVLLFPLYLAWQLLLALWYVQLILKTKVDVVHPQSKDDFIAATFAGRLLGKSIVWTDHADLKYIFANHRVWYKNPVGKLVYFASRFANKIVLVSQSEQKLIETSVGHPLPARYTVIHNGVYDQPISSSIRKPEDEDAVIFCATSRLVTAKGIGELIEAFKTLSKNSNTYRLWLVGDGPDESMFKQQAANIPGIVFVGHANDPLAYVASADVFVHPSYHEGFSLSLVEAAMLSKPIIACNVGGNPELVTETNGLLIPAKDSSALHDAMKHLADNPALRIKLGTQAREEYVKQFEFSKIVSEKYIPIYEQVTKN